MKNDRALLSQGNQVQVKFLPSPQVKELILNYFKYNNFQDFNTWQQIAKTKLEYDYQEHPKGFICNITLKWDDWHLPQMFAKAQAHTKKSAKKQALGLLVDTLICQGFIARGFKEQNFVQKLPRRRRNLSEQSSDEQIQTRLSQPNEISVLLSQGKYFQCLKLLQNQQNGGTNIEIYLCWNHGLKMRSVQFLQCILRTVSGEKVSQVGCESWKGIVQRPKRQYFDGSQVKAPVEADLTDFIRYYQLQKSPKVTKIRQATFKVRGIPSENLMIKAHTISPTRQQLLEHFYPIQASKIFIQSQQKNKSSSTFMDEYMSVDLPNFQPDKIEVTIKMVEQLYSLLIFYCQDYYFCQEVLALFAKHIKTVALNAGQNIQQKYIQKGEKYYLDNKNLLAAEFLELLRLRLDNYEHAVSIQGMLLPKKAQQLYYVFNPKQPQELVARKINKKTNINQFQQMRQIANRQMVLLVSKISGSWIGQIVQLTATIRLNIPSYYDSYNQPHPVTLIRICNAKLFEKTSAALIQASKYCMELLQQHTHLIWQPPTFPIITVISELLVEWQASRQISLIVTPHSQQMFNELTNLGFKVTLLTPKTQQKALIKNTIVVSAPATVCCDLLRNYAFTRVLVQSAQSLSEVSILSALVKDCKQAWLIGDCYLPKMAVFSEYCQKNGMNISLFERLLKEGKSYLTFQSKIQEVLQHRNVLQWADVYVYDKSLRLLGMQQQLPTIKGFIWPSSSYRVCFLHHPQKQPRLQYLNRQAEITTDICSHVIRSGYTKPEQISCSTTMPEALPLLKNQMALMLRNGGVVEQKNFGRLLQRMTRMVSGSRYCMGELSIMMAGSKSVGGVADILGALLEGRRGVIIIGDAYHLMVDSDWSSFIGWCSHNKLVCIAQC